MATVERVTPGTESWNEYGEEHLQRYHFFKSYYSGRSVIDAACGTGYGTSFIAESGAAKATGIDISKDAVDFASKHFRHSVLHYREFDCNQINEFGHNAELVISFETIEHLHDPEVFIRNVAETLLPGGIFICSTPNKDRLSGAGHFNPFHPSELPWHEFKNLFEKYFTVTGSFHQSETVEYMRYMEIKHLMHQNKARSDAFFFNRIERWLRKITGKKFKPIPFFHSGLSNQHSGDLVIEPFEKPEKWHKTFIIVGTVKK
jgi:SAM-dependent methyltransferase